ncbi:MAG: hypothetical protein J7K75_00805 [Desulfuromonas sp.]|nr:hypothetical protein [Desulfuromonas sp.]
MNRDYAEKQDLWSEMNELWNNRQVRRRKVYLGVTAAVSLFIMVSAFAFVSFSTTTQDPLYLHVQGQQLEMEASVNDAPGACVDQRENTIEYTETLSI